MGKGDKKSKRGKIIMGSFGVRRPRKVKTSAIPAVADVKPEKPAAKSKTKTDEPKVVDQKPKTKRKPKAEVKTETNPE